jgi:hypothetical protein
MVVGGPPIGWRALVASSPRLQGGQTPLLPAAAGHTTSRRPVLPSPPPPIHICASLQERSDLLSNAPHLARPLPILMPCYKFWEVPFYWAGLKAYDLVAGEGGGDGWMEG